MLKLYQQVCLYKLGPQGTRAASHSEIKYQERKTTSHPLQCPLTRKARPGKSMSLNQSVLICNHKTDRYRLLLMTLCLTWLSNTISWYAFCSSFNLSHAPVTEETTRFPRKPHTRDHPDGFSTGQPASLLSLRSYKPLSQCISVSSGFSMYLW